MSPIHVQLPLDIKLREDATIANYVGGAGGRLLASDGVIFVWGPPGTGRSHLLQGVCHDVLARGGQAIYLSELSVYAPDILSELHALDVVCLDDVQNIVGEDEWEVALFHLINHVRDTGGKLVIAANQPSIQLAVQLGDLRSRILAAPVIETDTLDDLQKIELLQGKAVRQGFELSEEVARFILSRTNRDIPSLIDLVARLELETLRYQKRVTIPFVKQVIEG